MVDTYEEDGKTKYRPNRQTTRKERLLWENVQRMTKGDPKNTATVVKFGKNSLNLHETRTRQIVRTWVNEGIAWSSRNANYCGVTEEGAEIDEIV